MTPIRKRALLACIAGLLAAAGPARGLAPPLYALRADDVRGAMENGATFVGHLDGRLFVERYEPGGRLRGTYAGRAYEGRWHLDGVRLCTEIPPTAPFCVTLLGASGDTVRDGTALWLHRDDGRAALYATYRRAAPWTTRSRSLSARVTVLSRALDAFGVEGTVPGLPADFVVWTGRDVASRVGDTVVIHGTTDGVTFTADRVTRPDGAPIP